MRNWWFEIFYHHFVMVSVPPLIKKVFDTFPLKEYPAVTSSTSAINDSIEENKYYFGDSNDSINSFDLGVFNVHELEGKVVPTDPFGLSQCLILCHKNDLKLPRNETGGDGGDGGNDGKNSLFVVAYNASPDMFLPILIENDFDAKVRDIRLFNEILSITSNKLEDNKKFLINEMIDNVCVDLWILCIYLEHKSIDLSLIFNLNPLTNSLTNYEFLLAVKEWRHISIRYSINNKTYDNKLQEFENMLQLIVNNFDNLDSICQIKIASFMITAKLLSGTKVYDICEKYADLYNKSIQLLKQY